MNINKLLAKVFGSSNEREVKRLRPLVEQVNAFEPEVKKLSDGELLRTTPEFRERLMRILGEDPARITREKAKKGGILDEALNEVLPEVFARVREAALRTVEMRHFDVQLIGGAVLHSGKIAEMRTGEGKTLVATLAASLNAIAGRGVHVVTTNDYLARRDAEWMGRIYKALGLTVGCIQHDFSDAERQQAYGADITYGTNNEFGFDYLRDNMKFDIASLVQRSLPIAWRENDGEEAEPNVLTLAELGLAHHYAIVDEVDSILIDEARTPLIISGSSEESTDRYYMANDVIPKLKAGVDFEVDEKQHTATLTEAGVDHAERILGVGNLYDPVNMEVLHCVSQALKAHTLYRRDKEYVVKDGEVIIVDEFTGRLMQGRRWSDGLHQAVESKEGVKIEAENQTLASITFQNYFRMYAKLGGMTGTAETEAGEFHKIYDLDVVAIPTHRPMIRDDSPDIIYRTIGEKWKAVADEIEEVHKKGQPILVGTVSVENSEEISKHLTQRKIAHNVLNAKHHEREAEIIAQAGRLAAVTIATNMAGRGTDIVLGGNPEFLAKEALRKQEIDPSTIEPDDPRWLDELAKAKRVVADEHEEVVKRGGLYILGTERHESRRIDNQLRGRSGRQGDPGLSRFFLSLEDDLMRIFAGDRVKELMRRLGMTDGVPIESKMVSKRVEGAQKSVEGHNFDIRKRTVEYDDVMNKERETIYTMRRQLLEGADQRERVLGIAGDVAEDLVERYLGGPDANPDDWDWAGLEREMKSIFGVDLSNVDVDRARAGYEEVVEAMREAVTQRYGGKEVEIGEQAMRWLERNLMLQVVDQQWKDHLLAIDHLRQGIGLSGYAQKDPLVEYKRESYDLFSAMLDRIEIETLRLLFNIQVQLQQAAAAGDGPSVSVEEALEQRLMMRRRRRRPVGVASKSSFTAANESATEAGQEDGVKTVRREGPKIRRNEACPCGSGKKYKKCCGR
ncbi:MAG TPA: preprotein translocase subunit SecA [Blastocatellia bacterium]|nr:preprotein translocase subunit SecA [Blastocatellia bacterium]